VEELVLLDSGDRLALRHDRGFSCDADDQLSEEEFLRCVENALLPDEVLDSGAEPMTNWQWVIDALAVHGIEASAAQIEHLPLRVDLDVEVQSLIQPKRPEM